MAEAKRNHLPLADAIEEIGSSGCDNHFNGKGEGTGANGRGTVELNETEKLMIFGLMDNSENGNNNSHLNQSYDPQVDGSFDVESQT